MNAEPNRNRLKALGLFLRAGVFYAVLCCPIAGVSMEIALHGASNLDDAVAAVQTLTQTPNADQNSTPLPFENL